MRQAKDHICQHGPEFGEGTGGKEVSNCLLEVVEDDTAVLNGFDDGREGVEKDHIGGFDGDVGAGAKSNTDVCLLEGWGVILLRVSLSDLVRCGVR